MKREQGQRAHEKVSQAIQAMIQSGDLQPGDLLLSERELVKQFGVSRSTIRQALQTLADRSIVAITPRGGAYVRTSTLADVVTPVATMLLRTPEDVLHLTEVRRIIEVEAARLAAVRATEGEIFRMQEAAREFTALVTAQQDATLPDTRFHLALCQATHNPFLAETMRLFLRLMENEYRPFRAQLVAMNETYRWDEQHFALVSAIAARDADEALRLMSAYLDDVREAIRTLFASPLT